MRTVALLLLLAGCSSPVIFFERPGDPPALAFLVAAGGGHLRSLGPVQSKQRVTLIEGESTLVWIGLSASVLEHVAPGFDTSMPAGATLTVAPNAELSASIFADPMTLRLPPDSEILEVDREGGHSTPRMLSDLPALSTLLLTLLSNPEFCDPDPTARLEPFGAEAELSITTTRSVDYRLTDLLVLDPSHVLVLGGDLMFVLEAGGQIPDPAAGRPGPILYRDKLGPISYGRSLALDPIRRPDGSRHLLMVGWYSSSTFIGPRSHVFEFAVTPERIERLPDPEIAPELGPLPAMNRVVIAPDQTALVLGEQGWLLVRSPGDTVFRQPAAPAYFSQASLGDALFTGTSTPAALLGLDAFRIGEGDPRTGAWSFIGAVPEIPPIFTTSRNFNQLASGPAGEVWASGDQGVLARSRAPQQWEWVDPPLPPSLLGCQGATLHETGITLRSMVVTRSEVIMGAPGCSALLRIDRRRGCASLLRGPDGMNATPQDRFSRVVRVAGGRLYAGGGQLGIYVSPLGDAD